jgi:hypothetical protein
MLKTKAAGWELFCTRLAVPPYLLWHVLPRYDRFRRAMAAAGHAAYDAEGFDRWRKGMKEKRGDGDKPDCPFTADGKADSHEKVFRERVTLWQG